MSRPSDNMQPAGKRRPGEQLTKDNADDDDEGTAIDPGTWGKADQVTMARRKVVRVRRGGGAEPAPAPQPAPDEQAAAANPFSGVSLAVGGETAANPFAGVSMLAATKTPEVEKVAEPAAVAQDRAAAKDGAAAQAEAASKPTEESTAADDRAAADAKESAAAAAAAANKPADEPADKPADASKAEAADKEVEADNGKNAESNNKDMASSTSLFGGAAAGGFGALGNTTGGFGSLGSSGAFGGFGGFAAAAKEGGSGGGLFGSYTAPQPGGLFAPGPAFSAARQSKDGEANGEGAEGEGAEGDAVFGGPEIAPVVQLSEVPKQTGEEEEDTLYSADGSLFEFVNGKEWRERGKGEIRINLRKATHQARLVMRQRGSQRLLLNANLYPKMTTSKMVGGKGVTFAAVNAAPVAVHEGKEDKAEGAASQESQEKESKVEASVGTASVMRTYAFKVKNSQKIDEFISTVDLYKGGAPGTAAPAEVAAAEIAV